MTNLRPRNNLVLVEKITVEMKSSTGIILPSESVDKLLTTFQIVRLGKAESLSDLKIGDIVLGEDMFVPIDPTNKNIGLLDQKYIHVVEEKNARSN